MALHTTTTWRWGILLWLTALALPAAALELDYYDSELWTRDRDCEARGDTLLVALEYGLQIWDLGDPAQPLRLADLYLDGHRARSVESLGDLAAVTTHDGSLYLIDITDLTAPALLGQVSGELGGSPDLVIIERAGTPFAITAGKASFGLRVYELTNPAAPLLRGTLNASGLESLALRGDLVFALSQGGHLRSVDAADLDQLVLLDQLDLTGNAFMNLAVGDSIAVAAADDEGFYVIDIADSTSLAVVAHVHPTVNAVYNDLAVKEVFLAGGLLYAVTDQAGPLVYDMTDPAAPLLVGYDSILDTGLPVPYGEFFDGDMALDQSRLYACHWDDEIPGALIFDVAGLEPLYVGRTESPDFTRFAAVSGNMFYGCSGESGLFGFELVAGALEPRGHLLLPEVWGAEAHGTTVYIASTDYGLVISDWSDPQDPQILGGLDVGQARSVKVIGDVAFVAAYIQGLSAVDISDPGQPLLLDRENPSGVVASARLDVAGTLAATADLNYGVNFWDVSNPADIQWLGNYDLPQKIADVKLHGSLAYVASSGDSLHVLNVADPAAPVLLAKFGPKNPTGLEIDGLQLLVSAAGVSGAPGGLFAYALTDRINPDPLFYYYTTGTALGVASEGGLVLVADDSALTLLAMGLTPAETAPLAGGPRLDAWPNPFNPRTDLRFDLAAPARGSLDVFDLSGRHLRRLAEGGFAAGAHQFAWDGRDDGGRALPSGVYFARLAAQDASGAALGATRKLVLLR